MLRAIKRMREVSKAHGKREVLIRALRKMELKLDEPRHKQRVAALNGEYYPGTPIYSYPEYLKVDYVNNPYVPIKKERTTKIISWLMLTTRSWWWSSKYFSVYRVFRSGRLY